MEASTMICEIKQQENCPSFVDDNDNDNNKLSGGSRKREKWLVKHKEPSHSSRLQLPELPTEIWVLIMWKLPIKPLHACKCVSKTWHSHVSDILISQKGIDLPPYGLLFEIMRKSDDDILDGEKYYLGYLSFVGDNKFTKWSVDDGESGSATVAITDHQNAHKAKVRDFYDDHGSGLLLGNLTIEFGSLIGAILRNRECKDWNMHRGLILGFLDLYTYLVYNPATKEAFIVHRSVSQASLNRGSPLVAIINLSDCPLSTECNFRVVRFVKAISMTKGMVFVEVYSSNKHEWCVSKFRLKKAVIEERWHVGSGVFVNNTLFFLTNKRHAVGVQFHSSGQVRRVYSLRLPQRITKGFCESGLGGSQGSLYLSYHKFPNLWIWKHTGSSKDADAWIPQLIFKKSGISLCKPVVENFLRQSVADYSNTHPLIMHPQAPVAFISVHGSIFACHLLNDTVEKIVELNERNTFIGFCLHVFTMLRLVELS